MSADGGGAHGAAARASSSCAGADGGADDSDSAAAIALVLSTLKCTEIDERGPWHFGGAASSSASSVSSCAHRRVELAARALVRKLREHGAPHRPGAPFCFAPAAVAARRCTPR